MIECRRDREANRDHCDGGDGKLRAESPVGFGDTVIELPPSGMLELLSAPAGWVIKTDRRKERGPPPLKFVQTLGERAAFEQTGNQFLLEGRILVKHGLCEFVMIGLQTSDPGCSETDKRDVEQREKKQAHQGN